MRILIIQGHPDAAHEHFGDALAARYLEGARAAGHEAELLRVAELEFPLIRSKEDWGEGVPPDDIRAAQAKLARAEHVVILYPLWLGTMPAMLKGFLEQLFRPGFAISDPEPGKPWRKRLAGKSARVIVTMGMPGFVYRWFFHAHSLKSLKRNILHFVGIKPVRATVIGNIEGMSDSARAAWLERIAALGRAAR